MPSTWQSALAFRPAGSTGLPGRAPFLLFVAVGICGSTTETSTTGSKRSERSPGPSRINEKGAPVTDFWTRHIAVHIPPRGRRLLGQAAHAFRQFRSRRRRTRLVVAQPVLSERDLASLLLAVRALPGPRQLSDAEEALLETTARGRLRVEEAIALRWGDIDWNTRTLRVARSIHGARVVAPKSGTARTVRLTRPMRKALREWTEVAIWRRSDDPVFADPRTGGRLNLDRLRRRFRAARQAAGLSHLRLIHLRRGVRRWRGTGR
jgi:integrase